MKGEADVWKKINKLQKIKDNRAKVRDNLKLIKTMRHRKENRVDKIS